MKLNKTYFFYSLCSLISSIMVLFFFYILLIMITSTTSLNFSFPRIGPENQNKEIITEGNGSYISDQGIQVTPDEIGLDQLERAGRATYITPLQLWDNASGEMADFSTNFTFVVDSNDMPNYADGLTFFLAENNSQIMSGGAIGLPVNSSSPLDTLARFVAVEFDSHWNNWDPKDSDGYPIFEHVGINVNSITSVQSSSWNYTSIQNGILHNAQISYNSTSKNLTVLAADVLNSTRVDLHWIVDLRKELPEQVILGFTAATGRFSEKNNVKSWSFYSSSLQIDGQKKRANMAAVVVAFSFCLCLLATVFGFGLWLKKRRANTEVDPDVNARMDEEFKTGIGPKRFPYNELVFATNNFSEEEKLGEGGFGEVYRGFLTESSSYIAVKKVSRCSTQGIKEYVAEVKIISKLSHRNLVKLIGWCHKKQQLLLVYEFMKNGSLDTHLFKDKNLLTWKQRFKIAQGLASVLLYLHEGWEQCVLHMDIKSSNIMLDSNFNAKLGDFGIAKLVDHERESNTICSGGTIGYMAPERCLTGKASKGSDVYSFGIVSLEIACGQKCIDLSNDVSDVRLVDKVWDLYRRNKLIEAADTKLAGNFDTKEMERLMIVGLWCAHPDISFRPSIRQAVQVLNFEAPQPSLPSEVPVMTYSAFPVDIPACWLCGLAGSDTGPTQSSNPSFNVNISNNGDSSHSKPDK